jgi:dolichyldiphosphatase
VSFLICHLHFRHRFASTGSQALDRLWRVIVYLGLLAWAAAVAYSRYAFAPYSPSRIKMTAFLIRYHLQYHTPHQILWGLGIGIALGSLFYVVTELAPSRRPHSIYARTRNFLVGNKVSTWLQIRDGWAIWADGGREDEWVRWRAEWEKRRIRAMVQARKGQ